MVYRKSEIERITVTAIAAARSRKKKLCSVDKANVLETSVPLAQDRHGIRYQARPRPRAQPLYVDNAAMQLARNPNQFDVFVTETCSATSCPTRWPSSAARFGMLSSASLGAGRNSLGMPFGLYEPAVARRPTSPAKASRIPAPKSSPSP